MKTISKWTALVIAMGCFFYSSAQDAERKKCRIIAFFDESAALDTSAGNWTFANATTQESHSCNPTVGVDLSLKNDDVILICYHGDCNRWIFNSDNHSGYRSWEYHYFFQSNYHLENPLQITAFSSALRNERVPAMLGILNFKQWSADGSSLQQGLNAIPGVMMESRGQGGSPRINIRGSMLRSTFGIRNVRMYFNGFALTSPDGTTPMEVIDPMWVQEAEVVKGPASVEYGNGTGGVILMKGLRATYGSTMLKSSLMMGSWGYNRLQYGLSVPLPAMFHQRQLSIAVVRASTHGYREQESNERTQLLMLLNKEVKSGIFDWFRSNGERPIGRNITQVQYHKGQWGLPGSLNAKEMRDNRQMARPFSLTNNARLERERWMMGFGQDRHWNEKWQALWRMSYQASHKINPYGTSSAFAGFKDETNQGMNARAQLSYQFWSHQDWSASIKGGGEFQREGYTIEENKLLNGEKGDSKYRYDMHYNQSFIHAGVQVNWRDVWVLQAGSAWHNTSVDLNGHYGSQAEEQHAFSWNPGMTPRVASSVKIFAHQYLFANYGSGFSNPNVFEQVDYTNQQFNAQLQPEWGQQWEWGWKGDWKMTEWQIARYTQAQNNIIVPGNLDAAVPFSYINAGSTQQNGVEFVFQYHFEMGRNKDLRWNGWFNGAQSDYAFDQFQFGGNDYSGKVMPGTPLHTAQAGVDLEWKENLQLTISNQWIDKMPLNYEGTVWSNPYHLMQCRLSGNIYLPKEKNRMMSWYWMLGVNNALNAQYSSFHQLNDANGRYYNPSPVRNFYVGLSAYVHRHRYL
jgi:iron complex outermembrane receptor protein